MMRHTHWTGRAVLLALAAALVGLAPAACRRTTAPEASASGGRPEAPAAAPGTRLRVVALGDSLTAGYGLNADQAYPALLQARLDAAGLGAQVVNAGVSGDTSAGGLRRADWALDGEVGVLIVALGGNDALRGLPIEDLEKNLSAIVEKGRARGVEVILAGMEAPPNLGPAYTRRFRAVYRAIADRYGVALLPFLLDGVAGQAGLNQSDGIHPNAEGTAKVADNLWPFVERAVRAALAS